MKPWKGQVRRTMKATSPVLSGPGSAQDVLAEVLRTGAQQMLATAIEAEVATYIDEHKHEVDDDGRRVVVRNGHHRPREIHTGVGTVEVKQPRVNDKRVDSDGTRFKFTSKILPPYLRRTKNLEEFIPWLYLKGISTNDFSECLQHLTGNSSASLSPTTVVRLKEAWTKECQEWSRRSLANKHFVYLWVDGVHFNVRLEDDRQCILVVMGATKDGKKELVAIADGYRESAQSWKEILVDLRSRGLERAPTLAIGDGALGFWKALREVFPTTRQQRCWVHKTANILNKLPKHKQPAVKSDLQDIWMAETREEANKAFELCVDKYGAKYPKAIGCLKKDREEMLAFYDFPAEHWTHLRTTNPIESMFATVRLRHRRTKGSGSRVACLAMVFKLAEAASKKWRRLTGAELVRDVIDGVQFKNGIRAEDAA
jgi:transposase-like protein